MANFRRFWVKECLKSFRKHHHSRPKEVYPNTSIVASAIHWVGPRWVDPQSRRLGQVRNILVPKVLRQRPLLLLALRCCSAFFFFFFFPHISTFYQLLDKSRGRRCCPFFPPPVLLPRNCITYRVQQSYYSTALRFFIECCYNTSRSRTFRKSTCAQEKVPYEFIRVCTRGNSNSRN